MVTQSKKLTKSLLLGSCLFFTFLTNAQNSPTPQLYGGLDLKADSSKKAACQLLTDVEYLSGCQTNKALIMVGARGIDPNNPQPDDLEAADIELYNESAQADKRGGVIALVANAVGRNSEQGFISFVTKNGANSWKENMRIDRKGNVGVGYEWPMDKMVLNGTLRIGANETNHIKFEPYGYDPTTDWAGGGMGLGWWSVGLGWDPNFNLSGNTTDFLKHRPLLLQGKHGVGIATENLTFSLNANGTACLGLEYWEINRIANKPSAQVDYKLYVGGGIRTEEVFVDAKSGWADYVFDPKYKLMPIGELSTYVKQHKHLPNMPNAETVEANGIKTSEMFKMQQEKIEELTLYIMQLQEKLEQLDAKISGDGK